MKLNVGERLIVGRILPEEADFTTLKVVRDLKSALSFSEKEHKDFEIEQQAVGKQIFTKWNAAGDKEIEIKIGEKATDIIVKELKTLDTSKKLTQEHMSVYEKFVVASK